MVSLAFCRSSQDAVTCSAFELNGVTHLLVVAEPASGTTLREQTRSTLEDVLQVLQGHDATESLVHLTVFLADPSQMAACRQIVRETLGQHMPATSYVPQPPCSGALVAVEVLALGHGREKVQIQRLSEQLVLTQQDGRTWVYADQATPLTSAAGVYEKTICSYQHLDRLLPQGGARLDQVLRTWLYLGGIVDDDGPVQRYKELNRARAEIYEDIPFLAERLPAGRMGSIFPASTGIGTNGRGITISALALLSDQEDVIAVPLENPRQTAAFAYAAHYSPQSPKFSRGMAVVVGEDTTLFISGTASITNSETQHLDDVVGQTQETLENIAWLISEENLASHGLPGHGTTLEGLAVARVYIKHLEDYAAVRAVCEQRLPGVPLTYVAADVCRTNLLVEIEGIAYAHCTGEPSERKRRCVAPRSESRLLAKHHLCPESCPERTSCPHAILH